MYSCFMVSGRRSLAIHRRRPARWFALLTKLLTWSCQLRRAVIVTPRCLWLAAMLMVPLSMERGSQFGNVVIMVVLSQPNLPCQDFAHCAAEVTACWSDRSESPCLGRCWCSRASSAYRSVSAVAVVAGRSLIKTTKRTGPRCEPWGTPAKVGCGLELLPLTWTSKRRLVR